MALVGACAALGAIAATGPAPVAARVGSTHAPPTGAYRAIADAYVSARRPHANFGRARTLLVRRRPAARTFLKFDLRPAQAADVHVALRLWSRRHGAFVARVLDTAKWRERRITWRNAPRMSGRSRHLVRAGKTGWLTIDLTGDAWNGSVVTVVLAPAGKGAGMRVASRESKRAPQLLLGSAVPPPPPPPASPPPAPPVTRNACGPPYSAASPWNRPIGSSPQIDPASAQYVNYLTQNTDDKLLTSDPTQYTYPVFYVGATTLVHTIRGSGTYSNVHGPGAAAAGNLDVEHPFTISVPVPLGTAAANGSDGQAIIVDPETGDEWAFWQLQPDLVHAGDYTATNGYHYNIGWSGVPPKGFGSRGPGMTYLAGLIRPCEIAQGHIDHAIAFAFRSPSGDWVYPATKSDGDNFGDAYPEVAGVTKRIPEGGRFQLDPSLTDDDLGPLTDKHGNPCSTKNSDGSWKLTACLVIAHALQQYGMIVADHAGRAKIYAEYSDCDVTCTGWTAHWGETVNGTAVPGLDEYAANAIPLAKLRAIKLGPLDP